ncbi:hypothetical protein QR680_018369 [Steinernema hermaphroditum]|uniref:protein-disulfide reductase n=1 Tax=Steinernema hermaphroditum TaxID=289476 RepID=A0AA39LQ83_9BILA|nr:hypothetical protein QR680_018369 [Steinernema hermaphroditum]
MFHSAFLEVGAFTLTMAQLLEDVELVLSNKTTVKASEALKGKIVALYFSAHWCAPCKMFTPKLKEFYDALKAAGKNFEVVFVSFDRNAKDLEKYYNELHGDWPYVEFGDEAIETLSMGFNVSDIPALHIIDAGGRQLVDNARPLVTASGAEGAVALFEEWAKLL